MNWRFALILGAIFVALGAVYWFVQRYEPSTTDLEGAVMLVALGVAMAFGFTVLLRGSREL